MMEVEVEGSLADIAPARLPQQEGVHHHLQDKEKGDGSIVWQGHLLHSNGNSFPQKTCKCGGATTMADWLLAEECQYVSTG